MLTREEDARFLVHMLQALEELCARHAPVAVAVNVGDDDGALGQWQARGRRFVVTKLLTKLLFGGKLLVVVGRKIVVVGRRLVVDVVGNHCVNVGDQRWRLRVRASSAAREQQSEE